MTAVATTTIHSVLKEPSVQARIKEVLGKRAAQFASSLVTLTNAKDELKNADPNSVLAAAMTAALLDLPISKDLGFAHIVPYKGVAQFQMGYKGFIQLAMRTGQYRHLNACAVCNGELISYSKLSGEIVLDENSKIDDRTIGYAAYMELINGFRHAIYWTTEQVQAHSEKFSQAVKGKWKNTPWFTNFDAMALKTLVKALLSKWGILSIEMQRALVVDQAVLDDVNGEPTYIDNDDVDTKPPVGRIDMGSKNGAAALTQQVEAPQVEAPHDMGNDPAGPELFAEIEKEVQRTGMATDGVVALAHKCGAAKYKDLTIVQAERMIAELRNIPNKPEPSSVRKAARTI